MENEVDITGNIKKWIIVGVVAFVTFLLVFIVTNKLVNGGKKKNVDPTPKEEVVEYSTYSVGDEVILKDNSKWHVLYESKKDSEYVSLLSDEDVNTTEVLYGNINSFLKGTYKTNLIKSLNAESSNIVEIRLLAYLDLATISKADSAEFLPNVEVSKYDIPEFIYKTQTVTDTIYQTDEANNPVMICVDKKDDATASTTDIKEETTSTKATFCLGDSTEALPVRPVVVISKKLIGKTNSSQSNKDNNNNSNNTSSTNK